MATTKYKVVQFIGSGKYIALYSQVRITETAHLTEAMLFRDRIHADGYLKQFGQLDAMKLVSVEVTVTVVTE